MAKPFQEYFTGYHGIVSFRVVVQLVFLCLPLGGRAENQDALIQLWGTRYETRSDGVWSVYSNVISTLDMRIVSTHSEMLTGRTEGVRRLSVDVDANGVSTTNIIIGVSGTPRDEEYVRSPIQSEIHRGHEYGLVLFEEMGELGIQYSFDMMGRIGLIENYLVPDIDHMWPMEERYYTRLGDLGVTARILGEDGSRFVTVNRYDLWGNKVSVSNSVGNVEHARYDPFGHILEISGAVTPARFDYDTAGRMTKMLTTRDGETWDETSWIYEPATGNCLTKRFADGSSYCMQYTPDGLLARVEMSDGAWRAYEYDGFRHLKSVRYSSEETPWFDRVSDALGHIRQVNGSNGYHASFEYNTSGVLVAQTTIWDGTNMVEKSLDQYGREDGVRHVRDGIAKGRVSYGYSSDGFLKRITITNSDARVLSVVYSNFAGRVMTTSYQHGTTHLEEICSRTKFRPELITGKRWLVNGVECFCSTNEYDAAGRTVRTDGNHYVYDTKNQFVSGAVNALPCSNQYDCAGNVVKLAIGSDVKTFSVNNLNQLMQIIETNRTLLCRYDASGNLVSDGKCSYSWDGEDRLVGIRPESPKDDDFAIENYYDFKGRRIKKVVRKYQSGEWLPQSSTEMVYDGNNLIYERRVGTGNSLDEVEYFWGASYVDRRTVCGGSGSLVAVSVNGVFFIPRYDNNLNVIGYWNASGESVVSRTFSPTGVLVEESGTMVGCLPIGFGTKYLDRENGLVYFENRCYAPWLGRWLSRDKAEESGGRNLYCFVGNHFGYCSDTAGMFSWSAVAIALIEGAGLVLDRTPVSNIIDDTVIDAYGGPVGFMNATERELASKGGSLPRDMFAKARARNSKAVESGATGIEGSFHSQLQSLIRGSAVYAQKKAFIIRRLGAGTAHKGFVNIDFQDAGENTLGYAIGGAQLHYDYDQSSCSVRFTLEDTYDFTGKGHMWGRLEKKGFLVTYPVKVDIEIVKPVKAK